MLTSALLPFQGWLRRPFPSLGTTPLGARTPGSTFGSTCLLLLCQGGRTTPQSSSLPVWPFWEAMVTQEKKGRKEAFPPHPSHDGESSISRRLRAPVPGSDLANPLMPLHVPNRE